MAVPAFDADGKLWSVQYVNSDGSKRFARESRKEGCFHVVGSTDPVGDLNKAAAIVVAEGYATAVVERRELDGRKLRNRALVAGIGSKRELRQASCRIESRLHNEFYRS